MEAIRILIVGESEMFQNGMADALKSAAPLVEFKIENAFSSEKAVGIVKPGRYDIIIMDYKFSNEMNGCEASRLIIKNVPDSKIIGIALKEFPSVLYFKNSKVKGIILNNIHGNELYAGICNVLKGHTYYQDEVKEIIEREDNVDHFENAKYKKELFTLMEQEIMKLMSIGMKHSVMLNILGIKSETLKTHKRNIRRKKAGISLPLK